MPFQFMCPQGHLLEGHESQMGQQTQCPVCGTAMIVPILPGPGPTPGGFLQGGSPGYPPGYPPPGYPSPHAGGATPWQPGPANQGPMAGYLGGHAPHAGQAVGAFHDVDAAETTFPQVGVLPEFQPPQTSADAALGEIHVPREAGSSGSVEAPKEPSFVTILCPNNHELQTPLDMIGQDAMCPQCSVQFRLRYEDSLEYREEKKKVQARRADEFGTSALKWAIVAAVIVVLGIITMIVLASIR